MVIQRIVEEQKPTEIVKKAADVADIVKLMLGKEIEVQEHFMVFLLDNKSVVSKALILHKGTLNQSLVHPRDVFREAVAENAAGVIVAHNHPSGDLTPSGMDIAITDRLKDAGKILGIEILDHVIVAPNGSYYSFHEEDIM